MTRRRTRRRSMKACEATAAAFHHVLLADCLVVWLASRPIDTLFMSTLLGFAALHSLVPSAHSGASLQHPSSYLFLNKRTKRASTNKKTPGTAARLPPTLSPALQLAHPISATNYPQESSSSGCSNRKLAANSSFLSHAK